MFDSVRVNTRPPTTVKQRKRLPYAFGAGVADGDFLGPQGAEIAVMAVPAGRTTTGDAISMKPGAYSHSMVPGGFEVTS